MWDISKLAMLRELQLRGTITAVAEALSYSASTVSHHLAQLERDVGEPLLQQAGRRVRLTAQGELLAAYAADVISLEESTRAELQTLAPREEVVRVALMESSAWSLLPPALDALSENAPFVRLEGVVVPPEEGLSELETRVFDLAVAEQYPGNTRTHREGLVRIPLGSDPIRVAVAHGAPVEGWSELAERPWVMEPEGTAARAWGAQQCRAAGFEPDVRFVSADLQTHLRLIESGHAVGWVPELLQAMDQVKYVDFGEELSREVFLAHRSASGSSRGVMAVVGALTDAFASLR